MIWQHDVHVGSLKCLGEVEPKMSMAGAREEEGEAEARLSRRVPDPSESAAHQNTTETLGAYHIHHPSSPAPLQAQDIQARHLYRRARNTDLPPPPPWRPPRTTNPSQAAHTPRT